MARSASEESGDLRSFNVISSGQESFATGEALAEWRSSEQLENGTPSTSPPFWDTDDDDDCGPRPSELYGKYTWKIDKFSQINKRELRSKAFEVGGYKWYILIYPQGCDVCNHLSLFLCVANHDKLLPGWSHFAQFTIAVVNKDPKKSKYSDTLHRFWKKEHDWGWKKFMELSKVLDGFIDADTLIIKAQVQVLRERADRPFRCLDCQYRRELVRVYLSNVEQICRRFVEERRSKLGKLVEDKAKWSSFCAFWLGIDQKSRHGMSREKTDAVLRVVVKQFFIEKEVTSTLVMDSLYSGLKALEGHSKKDMCRAQLLDVEDLPVPIVCIEQDMFVLADDVLLLLERAALEPLPPKDDKGPQTRMKDGSLGEEFNKDSIERDERRLTELGRRTIEIFVLAHIFSKIEVAYQEAVALKRQEELIREEAAWLAVSEQKSKRGVADKEKKSKKKQGKQKRNNRKGKDKARCENPLVEALDKLQLGGPNGDKDPTKHETFEDVSDVSDSVDRVIEVLQPDSEERESSPVNWDTDASEVRPLTEGSSHGASAISAEQNEIRESNSLCTVDDSSSTCSTDSVPSVVTDGYNKVNLSSNQESDRSPTRGRIQQGRAASDAPGSASEVNARPPDARRDVGPPNGSSNQVNSGLADARRDVGPPNGSSGSCKFGSEPETFVEPLLVHRKKVEHTVKGEVSHLTGPSIKDQVDTHRPSKEKTTLAPPSPPSSSFKHTPPIQLKPELKTNLNSSTANVSLRRQSFDTTQLASSVMDSAEIAASSRSEIHRSPPKLTEKPLMQEMPVISRPLSAPVVPGPRPTTPVASIIQNQPIPSHSIASWVGHDPTPVNVHQSYRTAIMGTMHNPSSSSSSGFTQAMHKLPTSSSSGFTQPQSPNTVLNLLQPYGQPAGLMYPPMPMFPSRSSERVEPTMVKCSPSFGIINPSVQNDISTHDLFKNNTSIDPFPSESTACTSGRQSHGVLTDEFPHLDIINDLLEDEHGVINVGSRTSTSFQRPNKGFHHLNRQFSFPGDICMSNDLVGPSTSSSRFERTRSYKENGFQHGYGSIGSPFEHIHEFFPQPNLRPYGNGQIDALIPNQWQVSGSDLSYLSARTTEGVGHPYHIPDYSNLGCGSNGYAVFRPSNGH